MSGRTGQPNSPRARKVNVVIYFIVGAIFAVLLVTSVFANGAVSAEAAGPLREERRLEKRAPVPPPNPKTPKFDYSTAIHMSYLYYWAQRSGKLPYQRLSWRGPSCDDCRGPSGEDVTGGWYEASNALLFGFPFFHTSTMLGWIAWRYEKQLDQIGQLTEARDWVRVAADWTIRAHSTPNRLVAMRGIAETSDFKWQGPPEKWVQGMGYMRNNGSFAAYVDKVNRGSEIVASASASMSLCHLVFKTADPTYAARCLAKAKSLYLLATRYPGSFQGAWASKDPAMKYQKEYYKSSGFHDELALAAVFMYKATNETTYLTAAKSYYSAAASKLRKKTSFAYSWDDKLSAVALLLMEISNTSNTVYEQALRRKFTFWFPDCVGRKCDPGKDEGYGDNGCQCVFYTEDGLAVRDNWGSLASANNAAFIAHQFAAFLRKRNPADAYAKKLVDWSIRQTNYVLGDNKVSYSYMVGFGDPSRYCQYPLHISSFNSWIDFPLEGRTPYAIQQNFTVQGYSQPGEPKWEGPEYRIKQRFIVYGGILAGPYWYTSEPICDHWRFQFTEPAQDYTAAFLGAALPLVDIYGIRKKASDCGLDLGWSHPNAQKAKRFPKYAADDSYHLCVK